MRTLEWSIPTFRGRMDQLDAGQCIASNTITPENRSFRILLFPKGLHGGLGLKLRYETI